jgi:hypothetical protein
VKAGLTGRAASSTVAAKLPEAPEPAAQPANLPDENRS